MFSIVSLRNVINYYQTSNGCDNDNLIKYRTVIFIHLLSCVSVTLSAGHLDSENI